MKSAVDELADQVLAEMAALASMESDRALPKGADWIDIPEYLGQMAQTDYTRRGLTTRELASLISQLEPNEVSYGRK